jgi:AcrR family transcriptional regulator
LADPKDILLFGQRPREFPQERARRTYESLVKAASKVFVERGYDATQTPDIAAEAGVSVGTFYRYFTDKRDVFLEILRRDLSRSYEEVMGRLTPAAFEGEGRRATIEATIEILLAAITRHPELQRLFLELSLRDPDVAAIKEAYDEEGRRRVAELLAAICPTDLVADPEATAYIVHTAVIECAIHIAGSRGPIPVSRERAVGALTEIIYRALFGIEE